MFYIKNTQQLRQSQIFPFFIFPINYYTLAKCRKQRFYIILPEEEYMKLTRQDTNSLIPSQQSSYFGLMMQEKYLPKLTSSIITSEYLLGILFDKIYVPKLDEIQIGVLLNLEQAQINLDSYSIINFGELNPKELLIRIGLLMCQKNLNQIIFSYKSTNKSDMKQFTLEQFKQYYLENFSKIKELDLSMGRKTSVKGSSEFLKRNNIKEEQFRKNLKKKLQRLGWIANTNVFKDVKKTFN